MRFPIVCATLLLLFGPQWVRGDLPDKESLESTDSVTTFAVGTGAKTNRYVGRLATELFRQTVLLIAAEDFGLPIQDESLSSPATEPGEQIVRFDVSACIRPPDSEDAKTNWAVEIRRRKNRDDPKSSERIFLGLVPKEKSPRKIAPYQEDLGPVKYVDFGEVVEVYRDLTPQIIAALKESGFKPVDPAESATLSDDDESSIADIEFRLREMSFVSQFEALRAAHDLPATPQKHRLLAYGHANLGLLTQHHWSANHKVFFARALVHASRAFHGDPGEASLAARGYARALTGLHASALEDLKSRNAEPTPRLQAVDAFCRFRKDELLALAEEHPEIHELATLLACLVVEAATASESSLEIYEAATRACPSCFRVYASVAALGQIGLLHDITRRGPAYLVGLLPQRLGALEELPQEIETVIQQETVLPAELADALQSVEDEEAEQGIDWRLLGRLVRDEALVQAQRRMYFLEHILSVPTAVAQERFAEFVGNHELLALAMEPYSDAPDWEKVRKAAKHYVGPSPAPPEFSNMGPQFERLIREVLRGDHVPSKTSHSLYVGMRYTTDWIARDIVLIYDINDGWNTSDASADPGAPLDGLAKLSPYHPQHFLREMHREGISPDQLRTLETELMDRPALLDSLTEAMMEHEMPEDAIRVAEHLTKIFPCYDSFRTLAHLHGEMGDDEKRIQFLKQAVTYPEPSLASTRARTDIADYYMERGDYEQAEPYAAKAAESYAAWAMTCAIECYTGLEKYDLAEQWHIRRLERYGHTPDLWYTWCVVTGEGDIDAARSLVAARNAPYREKTMEEMTVHEALTTAGFYTVEGNDAAAADLRAHIARRETNPAEGMHAALLYLRGGEREEAIKLLHKCVGWTTSSENAPGAARRAGIFLKSLESDEPLESAVVEQLDRDIDSFDEDERLLWHAVFGEWFFHTGNPEQGLDLLKQAVAFPPATGYFGNYDRAFATIWLREHQNDQAAGAAKP